MAEPVKIEDTAESNGEGPSSTEEQQQAQQQQENEQQQQQQQQQQEIHTKVDKITALQDGIDSLSLAMFEALRGLRDAVAPESGNLGVLGNNNNNTGNTNGNANNNNNDENDPFEEFYQSYQNGDPETLARVRKITSTTPRKREDFLRIHAKIEMQKDSELVKKLAQTVLDKSADIDERVSVLPGMHRTRAEQMAYIEELLQKNHQVAQKLEEAYKKAQERRDSVRKFVKENTCAALGIAEDKD